MGALSFHRLVAGRRHRDLARHRHVSPFGDFSRGPAASRTYALPKRAIRQRLSLVVSILRTSVPCAWACVGAPNVPFAPAVLQPCDSGGADLIVQASSSVSLHSAGKRSLDYVNSLTARGVSQSPQVSPSGVSRVLTAVGPFSRDGVHGRTTLTTRDGVRAGGGRPNGTPAAASGIRPKGALVPRTRSTRRKERSHSGHAPCAFSF